MNKPFRVRQPEQTRAQILEAAIGAAHELGAGGLTLDAVVLRLPLSKGALLHHFPSKMALMEAMIDQLGDEFVANIKAEAAADTNPYIRLSRAYLRATINDIGQPEDMSLCRVILVACLIEPALAARWKARIGEVLGHDEADPAASDDGLMLRLIADGLWLADITGTANFPPEQRQALLHLLDPKAEAA